MNKKVNTALFILGATLFNIIVVIISFLLFYFLYAKFIMGLIPNSDNSWAFNIIFIASIVVSFFAYRIVLKFLLKKVDIEKYFDPIFVRKYKGARKN